MSTRSIEKLAGDFRSVVTDVEELLKATAGQTGDQLSSARDRVADSLKQMRAELESASVQPPPRPSMRSRKWINMRTRIPGKRSVLPPASASSSALSSRVHSPASGATQRLVVRARS